MAKDPNGFEEFAAARSPSLFRTARLLCDDWHLAEDLVQMTLGKLYSLFVVAAGPAGGQPGGLRPHRADAHLPVPHA